MPGLRNPRSTAHNMNRATAPTLFQGRDLDTAELMSLVLDPIRAIPRKPGTDSSLRSGCQSDPRDAIEPRLRISYRLSPGLRRNPRRTGPRRGVVSRLWRRFDDDGSSPSAFPRRSPEPAWFRARQGSDELQPHQAGDDLRHAGRACR